MTECTHQWKSDNDLRYIKLFGHCVQCDVDDEDVSWETVRERWEAACTPCEHV